LTKCTFIATDNEREHCHIGLDVSFHITTTVSPQLGYWLHFLL